MSVKARMFYPLQGITYLLSHPSLWHRVLLPFLVIVVISIALFILAFKYLFGLQHDYFVNGNWAGWIAYTFALVLTLAEASLGTLVAYLALMPFWEDSLFDAVLKSRKLGYLVESAHGDARSCMQGVLGGLYIIFFQSVVMLFFQVLWLVLLSPLHLLPVVGTAIYCYLNGWLMAFSKRLHYDVEIRRLSVSKSRKYAWKHFNDFSEFGTVAVFLELIPVLNLLFFWTNVVGAALWVADEIDEALKQSRRAARSAGSQGSHYVTFHPYDSSAPGLPTDPLLGNHESGAPPAYS